MIFNVFYTSDLPEFILKDHRACCEKIGISVKYHAHPPTDDFSQIYKAHGNLVNQLLENATNSEIVCMLDIDCLPYSLQDLRTAYQWVLENESFIGNAQNISHTARRNQIYAAASMCMIHKKAWVKLGKPDLSYSGRGGDDSLVDTIQAISLIANEVGFKYRILLPLGHDMTESSWQLGPICSYGKGTTYPGTWHYFRISELKGSKPALWCKRVNEILQGHEITPIFSSLNNYFERFQPFKKRVLNRLKNITRKFR